MKNYNVLKNTAKCQQHLCRKLLVTKIQNNKSGDDDDDKTCQQDNTISWLSETDMLQVSKHCSVTYSSSNDWPERRTFSRTQIRSLCRHCERKQPSSFSNNMAIGSSRTGITLMVTDFHGNPFPTKRST